MSNTSTFIKIVVANLVVATLVATYMCNNDSIVGLKGSSRKLQSFFTGPGFTTPPTSRNLQFTFQPGNFPNFPDFNSQTGNFPNFPNFPNFNPGSNPGFNFTPFVSGFNAPNTSGSFSFTGSNPGLSIFNSQGFNFTPIVFNGFHAPNTSANSSFQQGFTDANAIISTIISGFNFNFNFTP
jgi:hypothetical protein